MEDRLRAWRCSVWVVKWLFKRDVRMYLAMGIVEVMLGLLGLFTHRHGAMSGWSWAFVALGILFIGRAFVGDLTRRCFGEPGQPRSPRA
jgi:hypothetical protein